MVASGYDFQNPFLTASGGAPSGRADQTVPWTEVTGTFSMSGVTTSDTGLRACHNSSHFANNNGIAVIAPTE